MPTAIIEYALKLACLILEGIPVEQRRASAVQWFWMWWPLTKNMLKPEQQKQVEEIMQEAK